MSNLPPVPPNQPPQGYGYPPGQPYGQPPGYPPQPMGAYGMPGQPPQSNGWSVAALVTGLLGCIPGVGLIGVICGIVGLRRAKTTHTGSGMSIAGLVIGLLTLLVWGGFGAIGGVVYFQTKPNRALAGQYITALSTGAAATDGSYTLDPADVDAIKAAAGNGGKVVDVTTAMTVVNNNRAELTGFIQFSSGEPRQFRMTQAQANGKWQVESFELIGPGQRPRPGPMATQPG